MEIKYHPRRSTFNFELIIIIIISISIRITTHIYKLHAPEWINIDIYVDINLILIFDKQADKKYTEIHKTIME